VSNKNSKIGIVVKKSGIDTVSVKISGLKRHPLYSKVIKHSYKLMVHDKDNTSQVGDKVAIVQVRPISKLKRWKLLEIVKRKEAED
jgi:small subunit ribosomal protein S17